MKKILLILIMTTFFAGSIFAVPAKPGLIEFTQPDGTIIKIYLKGDEKVHWGETIDGYTILVNKEGYYSYAYHNDKGDLKPSEYVVRSSKERSKETLDFLEKTNKNLYYSKSQISLQKQIWEIQDNFKGSKNQTTGNLKLILILANFNNTTTTYTKEDFEDYMNQPNYNGTGSVKDYYYENSYGQLSLTTTVTDWVQVPNTHDYYGPDTRWREFAYDAIVAADPSVDYSIYDNDGDGNVEGVAIIHQGPGQEETANTSDIWSHNTALRWDYTELSRTFDGVVVDNYTTQPEVSGNGMATIGVFCHEFGHMIGAPDYYDTDYATGGQYDGTGSWDVMCGGASNGTPSGALPAHHNAYTKIYIYGWASVNTINTAQTVSMTNSVENNTSFYRYNTTTTNEFFLLENRQQIGFDGGLPGHGLIIYHADGDYINAHDIDNDNKVNATDPQGFYPVCAGSAVDPVSGSKEYGVINSTFCPFPGSEVIRSFTDLTTPSSKSWATINTNKPITEIGEINDVIYFNFMGGEGTPIACFIADKSNIAKGATVNFTNQSLNSSAWEWTFEGGNPSSYTGHTPPAITYANEGTFDVTLSINSGVDSKTVTDYINVFAPGGCDNIFYPLSNTGLYQTTGGYVSGNNEYDMPSQANFYDSDDYIQHTRIEGVDIWFGDATTSGSVNLTVTMWDDDGSGGSPGTVLATKVIDASSISSNASTETLTTVIFDAPVDLTTYGSFFLGVDGFTTTDGALPNIAIMANSSGTKAWTKYNGTWYLYGGLWGSTYDLAIFPKACSDPDVPPTVDNVSPTSFFADKGTQITITGSGLTGSTATIGGVTGNEVSNDGATLVVNFPAGNYSNNTLTVANGNTPDATSTVTVNTRNTIPVGGGTDPHTTIQGALDGLAAWKGTTAFSAPITIEVYRGTYTEKVTPDVSLNPTEANPLIIQNRTGEAPVIDASGETNGVYIGAIDYVELRGFAISGASGDNVYSEGGNNTVSFIQSYSSTGGSGISVNGANATVTNNLCYKNYNYGIHVNGSGAKVYNNTLDDNGSLSAGALGAQNVQLFFEGWETGTTGWTIGSWAANTDLPHTGSNAARLRNTTSSMTSSSISTAGYNNVEIHYWVRSDGNFEGDEYVKGYYSTDGGSNWNLIDEQIGAQTSYIEQSIVIPGNPSSVLLRFDGFSNGTNGQPELWYVDDIEVYGDEPDVPGGAGLYIESGTDIDIQNNIIVAKAGDDAYSPLQTAASGVTVTSDYNTYYKNGNANLIDYNGTVYTDSADWDDNGIGGGHDIDSDPLFVGGTDYHVQSTLGTFTTKAKAPVWPPDVADDPDSEWKTYPDDSPTIDAGNPSHNFDGELEGGGGAIDQGSFGNTPQATKGDGPLPVVWKAHNAICENGTIKINWATYSEINNDYFTVEKIIDDKFEPIAKINGSGNSSVVNTYSFMDVNKENENYYRIKQTDFDNQSAYSPIFYTKCNDANSLMEEPVFNIYPNPFSNQVVIEVVNCDAKNINVDIINNVGIVLGHNSMNLENGANTKLKLNTSRLPQGIYLIKISADGVDYSRKIIKN